MNHCSAYFTTIVHWTRFLIINEPVKASINPHMHKSEGLVHSPIFWHQWRIAELIEFQMVSSWNHSKVSSLNLMTISNHLRSQSPHLKCFQILNSHSRLPARVTAKGPKHEPKRFTHSSSLRIIHAFSLGTLAPDTFRTPIIPYSWLLSPPCSSPIFPYS